LVHNVPPVATFEEVNCPLEYVQVLELIAVGAVKLLPVPVETVPLTAAEPETTTLPPLDTVTVVGLFE
jgi:hypothetical protein